jgi:NOL1/NOP2/fmu family ribosome biogenesis protein
MSPVEFLRKRFLLPEDWLNGLETCKDQETIFVGTPEVMEFNTVKPLRRGIRLCRLFTFSVKPTTFAMQVLGRAAAANRIEVDEEKAKLLINGGTIEIDAEVENGFVIIVWQRFVVGVGIYKKPVLKSCIPKFRPVD